MRGEVQTILGSYFSKDTTPVHFLGGNDQLLLLREFYEHGEHTPYDRPDYFIALENKILIIEHFQFACFKQTRKGNTQHRELSKISKYRTGESYHVKIKLEPSGLFYVRNSIQAFDNHYRKIPEYVTRIHATRHARPIDQIITCFLIDDVSVNGSTCIDKDSSTLYSLTLACCYEFLNHLQSHPNVDWILTRESGNVGDAPVWFISQKYITEYLRDSELCADMCFPYNEFHSMQEIVTNPNLRL